MKDREKEDGKPVAQEPQVKKPWVRPAMAWVETSAIRTALGQSAGLEPGSGQPECG
ncbi:MAG TPA: hypothetical protein PLS53_09405 [Thermoanaerobaculaceae bacterium]|nr:hypothetical protein [Thermoanaerobaculaceae bacterium]HPS78360.1 hypothetical protein [Thermoanaerobaculaceae bacterium]